MNGTVLRAATQGRPYNQPLTPWRLIESGPSDVFSQMTLDRELFEEFIQNPQALPILRIYRVNQPGISVGHSWRSVDVGAALRGRPEGEDSDATTGRPHRGAPTALRLPVCIRPTGGGWVRHGDDLIYSVIARSDTFPTFGQVRTSYLSFHEAIQDAFQGLGVESRLFRCDETRLLRHCEGQAAKLRPGPKQSRGLRSLFRDRKIASPHFVGLAMTGCFDHPIATDVLVHEQKVAGGAQRRKKAGFLHQGSVQIPREISFESLGEAFLGAFERKFDAAWNQRMGAC